MTATEKEDVRQALSTLHVGSRGSCGADVPIITLDLQAQGAMARYVDDFHSCMPDPDGRTFVMNLQELQTVLWQLLPAPNGG